MKNKIYAGVIGLGVGEEHIHGFNSHPYCKVVKVCDFNKTVLLKARRKYPEIIFCESPEEILTDPNIDVVSIASYDNYHFEQALLGLKNDKHLFVEKPLVQFEFQAKRIKKLLLTKPNLIISSNLVLRRYEQFIKLKKLITKNSLGKLSYVYSAYNYGRLKKITEGWRGQIDDYSIVLGGGIHLIDLINWLQKSKTISVYAVGNKIQTKDTKFKYEDLITVILEFEDNLIAVLTINFGNVTDHCHQLEVFGTKGTFINQKNSFMLYNKRDPENHNKNLLLDKIHRNSYEGIQIIHNKQQKVRKGVYLYNFVESVIKNKQPEISKEELFDDLSICFAINKSLKESRKIKVDYL